MLVLRTSNFQGATIRPIVPRLLSLLFTTKFSSARLFKNPLEVNWIIFKILRQKPWKPNIKFEKENRQKPLIQFISVVYFLRNPLVYWKIFTDNYYPSRYFRQTGTIHPGIFSGWALWADSGPPRMSTIAPHNQFKPIRIRENLVMNYTAW